jgi:hypothetical protein
MQWRGLALRVETTRENPDRGHLCQLGTVPAWRLCPFFTFGVFHEIRFSKIFVGFLVGCFAFCRQRPTVEQHFPDHQLQIPGSGSGRFQIG